MKNRMVSPVSSGSLPQSFMTHSLCLPRTVSPICRQSHSPASQFTPIALTLKALPSPQFTRYPTIGGSMPALLKSGRRSLSPSSMAKSGAASALHLQPRANVNSDTMSPKAAMTTVIQVCTVRPRNVICARSTPIDSSFLRHLRRLVFLRFPAYASGGRNLFPTVRPMEVLQMIAYVVRCDVCAAEAFVPLNQDPDMAMSARGWRMRPHSKVCPDCVFALEGPKTPPSMAEVR